MCNSARAGIRVNPTIKATPESPAQLFRHQLPIFLAKIKVKLPGIGL